MGYLSRYHITSEPNDPALLEALNSMCMHMTFYDGGDHYYPERCKWYEYQEELTELSKQVPHLLIKVERTGEESPDVGRCWFRNGTTTGEIKPEMVWPDPPLHALASPGPDPRAEAEKLKAAALAKLTDEEKAALGL